MHKGVVLLTKADSKEQAISNVREFLAYYNTVWDWYQIGGRWNNMLAPKELVNQFAVEVNNHILVEREGGFISQEEVDKKQEELQSAWNNLELEGLNPYCNHYDLDVDGNYYDVMKLSECIDVVKDYKVNLELVAQEYWDNMIAEKDVKDGLSAYYAARYSDAAYGNFCFDTNVYNITECEAESIPEDIESYYAVVVDMHN